MNEAHLHAELIHDGRAEVGEGPHWDHRHGTLVWVDIMAGRIHRITSEGSLVSTIEVGRPVGSAITRKRGGLIAAVADGFLLLDANDDVERLVEVEAELPANRMNDAKADAQGRMWAGTIALDLAPHAGALYRIDPDHEVHRILDDTTLANGLDWSPDGQTLYFIDSTTWQLDAFDFDPLNGAISTRRTLLTFARHDGMPDGMTVDGEACLWVAFWGGACVRRYSPTGEHLATIQLPVPLVTSCCFGGDELGDLYITTAAGIHERLPPPAGGVYRARPGVAGQPPRVFAG